MRYWCNTCCCYSYSPHYHFVPLPYDPCRDERLREEGRREERKRRKHRPYVDITPALPRRYGC